VTCGIGCEVILVDFKKLCIVPGVSLPRGLERKYKMFPNNFVQYVPKVQITLFETAYPKYRNMGVVTFQNLHSLA
jgi:hypothetical protein